MILKMLPNMGRRKKIYAHCYIDDKNIGGFPGWLVCMKEIERMEEAYKTILKEDKTKV